MRIGRSGPTRRHTRRVDARGQTFKRPTDTSTYFEPLLRRLGSRAAAEADRAHDPRLLAETVHRALTTSRPRARWSVRPDRMRSALELLPDRVADRLVVEALRRWM